MKKNAPFYLLMAMLLWSAGCQKATITPTKEISTTTSERSPINTFAAAAANTIENFETGTKGSYATGTVALATGSWTLNDALIGNTTADAKNGTQSVRVRNSGILSNNFDFTTGASTVTVAHALYSTDASSTWQLWYSTNSGTSFVQSGGTITTSTTTLQTATFTLNVSGNVRFQLRKTGGTTNRINWDDISVTPYSSTINAPTLTSVSPSAATAGGASFTLTATGTNFTNTSVINWNGAALTTTFVSATSLTAVVPAANIATAGTVPVTVTTPTVGTSAAVSFVVQAAPAPVLSSVSPNSATAGGATFTLTATGSNFVSGSTINWNGTALTTTFVSVTSLSASVPAANIATAGTASVTVVTPGATTTGAVTFTINAASTGVKRFLFDATKGETAGNADWVIDQDASPQRVPTPSQSNITTSTAGTYWTGAISSWGIALVNAGDFVETLPSGASITYGNAANAQDLSKYDVFVIDEPNIRFTTAEKIAILNFVSNGGGLFMVSDHTISDRNNDGWDSPEIWNDFMTNNTLVNNPFGFSVDLTNITQVSGNVLISTTNPIMNGVKGKVTKLEFNNGATLSLQPTVNSTVQGLVWQNTYSQSTTRVMAASSTYGNGRVFMVTDSSPMDDGTGASGNNLFVGWPLYSHTQLFMNASLWLAKQ